MTIVFGLVVMGVGALIMWGGISGNMAAMLAAIFQPSVLGA